MRDNIFLLQLLTAKYATSATRNDPMSFIISWSYEAATPCIAKVCYCVLVWAIGQGLLKQISYHDGMEGKQNHCRVISESEVAAGNSLFSFDSIIVAMLSWVDPRMIGKLSSASCWFPASVCDNVARNEALLWLQVSQPVLFYERVPEHSSISTSVDFL